MKPFWQEILVVVERDGPILVADVARKLGKSVRYTCNQTALMRRPKSRHLRVAGWEKPRGSGKWSPLLVVGTGPNAPRPAAKTGKERNVVYREKHRALLRLKGSPAVRKAKLSGAELPRASWLQGLLP